MLECRDFLRIDAPVNEPEQRRACSTCKVDKPLSEFVASKNQKNGRMSYCKVCNTERNKRYRSDPFNLERACKRLYGYIKRRVRVKGFEIDFDPEFIAHLYAVQNGKCAYTGDPLSLQAGLPSTMSIDRIDSSIGYIKSNVALVTWQVNNAKQDMSMDEFAMICKKVVAHGQK